MIINIQVDTREDLSDYEKNVLAALAGAEFEPDDCPAVSVETSSEIFEDEVAAAVEEAAEEAAAVEKRKAAEEAEKKAAAAEKRKAAAEKRKAEEAAKKAAEEEKAAAEASPEEETEDEGTPAVLEGAVTREDAVKVATEYIKSGNAAAVKSVLADMEVRKVGEVPVEKLGEFIDRLEAL